MITSYFEFSDGLSNKYWYICTQKTTQLTVTGKLKKEGKVLTKEFATEELCHANSLKEIEAKLNKGYIEKKIPDWFNCPNITDTVAIEEKRVAKESILVSTEKGIQPQDIRRFFRAIRNNDINSVIQYLSVGLRPDIPNYCDNGYEIALINHHKEMLKLLTPYINTAENNKLSYLRTIVIRYRYSEKINDIIQTLLSVNYDFANDEGFAALLPYLKVNLVKQLLELVKINVRDLDRQVLFDSLMHKNKPVIIYLVDNGISMDGVDPNSGLSLMHLAFYHFGDDLPLIKKLLSAGADPYIYSTGEIIRPGLKFGGGENALDYAINEMSPNVIHYVEKLYVDFEDNLSIKTVLTSAMLSFSPAIKRFLSKHDRPIYDEHGNSLIHYVCCATHESTAIENIVYMLKKNIKINIVNNIHRNGLFYFWFNGSGVPWQLGDELNELLGVTNFFNAVLSKTSSMFWSQLRAEYGIKDPDSKADFLVKWFSGVIGDRDFLALLLQKAGADIECTDIYGMTPIMFYARYSLKDDPGKVAHPLLQKPANNSAKPEDDNLYDESSSEDRRYYALISLLRCRPNVTRRYQDDGATIVHHIQRHNIYEKAEILSLLYFLGADVNAKDNKGRTPLHYITLADSSASFMDIELEDAIIHLIAKGKANPNIQDHEGNTPLHLALADSDKYNLVETLLEYGANPLIANSLGETAEDLIEKLALQRKFAENIAINQHKQANIHPVELNWQPLNTPNKAVNSNLHLYASLALPRYSLDRLMITSSYLYITEKGIDRTYCIDKITGKTLFGRYGISYPYSYNGHLYAGVENRFAEIDPQSGKVLWSVGLGQDMSGPIYIYNDRAVCVVQNNLVGICLKQRKQQWKVSLYGRLTAKGYIVGNHLAILTEEARCTKVNIIDFLSGSIVENTELYTRNGFIDSFQMTDQLWVYNRDNIIQTLNFSSMKIDHIVCEFDDDEYWQSFNIMGLCNGPNQVYGLFKLISKNEQQNPIYRLCYLDGANAHTVVDVPVGGPIHYHNDMLIILDPHQKAVGTFNVKNQDWQIWQFPSFHGDDGVRQLFIANDGYIFVAQGGGASYPDQDLLYVLKN